MERPELHQKLDELLDYYNWEKRPKIQWGSIMIQIDFQAGKEVLTVKERTTKK